MRKGTSVIVELDGRNGSIGDVTSFLLHSDGSFYNCVCPGRDCDLVIFGGQGILGYDLGSASIKWKVSAGELPFSTEGYFPMATLPDGRAVVRGMLGWQFFVVCILLMPQRNKMQEQVWCKREDSQPGRQGIREKETRRLPDRDVG